MSETDRDALVTALAKCRVEDAPNPLFAEHDLDHIAGSIAPTVAALVAEAVEAARANPAPSPAVPVGALLASFEHEDWCCAKGCACHVRPCPGCTCLVDIVRRHIEALTATSEGPTCPGGMQAGLAGSSCWRSPAVPPAPTLAGLAEVIGPVLDRHVGWQMHRAQMADDLASAILAHLSPPGVPDRSDAGDVVGPDTPTADARSGQGATHSPGVAPGATASPVGPQIDAQETP